MKLTAQHLTLQIGQKVLCDHFNGCIQSGEMWGILGPNGSGKTSLLHTLGGLQAPTHGDIYLDHAMIKTLPPKQIARHIAVLFQDVQDFFSETVWDYCLAARYPHLPYFKTETAEDIKIVETALHQVDLYAHRNKSMAKLSGGEKRRAAIASVLAQTPTIYLLDEPTNHLDVRYQIQILSHFQQLVALQAAAVVTTLHDINWVQQFCNRVLLLFGDGRVMQGLPTEILTAENLTALYQHPIKKMIHNNTSLWWPAIASC